MDLNEMRKRFKEQKSQRQGDLVSSDAKQQDVPKASDSNETSNVNTRQSTDTQDTKQTLHFDDGASCVSPSNWNDATTKAINLLYQLEKCSYSERRESLALIESLSVPTRYEASWNQILRIWSTFAKDLSLNTKTLPNPDGVRYSQRPFPITGSSGVQDVIKEIIKYA